MGTKSRESIYGSSIRASAERAREARKQADRLACEAGISACSATRDRPSRRLRWVMPSMLDSSILKSAVLAATPIRPSRSTSCDDRSPRRSTSLNVTCAARTARRCVAIRTSAAIWWHYGQRRYRRTIHPRRGGRGSDNGEIEDVSSHKQKLRTNPQ
jgi:hypothetical protein